MNSSLTQQISITFSRSFVRRYGGLGLAVALGCLTLWLVWQSAVPTPAYAWPGGELSLAWWSPKADDTRSVAWGDWDGDGDLDLAVGNWDQPNRVYENVQGTLVLAWSSDEADYTTSVAWGDWDNDGDLDLVVGNGCQQITNYSWECQPNRVYENSGGSLSLAWSSPVVDYTTSVAWGDWDGDHDLDLAVGIKCYDYIYCPTQIYRKLAVYTNYSSETPGVIDTDRLGGPGFWSGAAGTYDVAWGDWDSDGDLDLAAGTSVYENDRVVSKTLRLDLANGFGWDGGGDGSGVAWGDWDRDGDLDLAVGARVYEYDQISGTLVLSPTNGLGWDGEGGGSSVAWGDWDNDGDLDLAVANDGDTTRVYEYDQTISNTLRLDPTNGLGWEGGDGGSCVAWGDWDNDGDLDLAVGNDGGRIRIYANEGGSLSQEWLGGTMTGYSNLAWGDWDGDGDLDLASGNTFAHMYENEGGGQWLHLPLTEFLLNSSSVAWGDWDGDGDLDLAADTQVLEYDQESGTFKLDPDNGFGWDGGGDDTSVAWGDWDGDGDLDLAAGARVYENDRVVSNTLRLDPANGFGWDGGAGGSSVAWGDWDRDGDLDLAVGNLDGRTRVFENLGDSGGGLSLAWSSPDSDWTSSVAWGDWDNDGDLDLAVGNAGYGGQPNRVYENLSDSGGSLALAWSSPERGYTTSVAWSDWDGDGDLDLAVGNACQGSPMNAECYPNLIYANESGSLSLASSWAGGSYSLAWGDSDNDGDLDLAQGDFFFMSGSEKINVNHSGDILAAGADSPTRAHITTPGGAAAPFFASARVLEGPTLPISYTLFDAEGDPACLVKAWYSLDGGSTWQPAVPFTITSTADLTASPAPTGTVHTYTWDVYGSKVMGASDSVVLRLDVYQGFRGPGPYQRPFRTARTLPFRLRGSQVRVVDESGPVAGAIVYRRAAGQSGPFEPYHDGRGRPFRTNPAGYLGGYGELTIGDQLVALLPITDTGGIAYTDSYTLYYTSAQPTPTGLVAHTVADMGVQTLAVSANHPLVLLNLDVSLQWDARNDSRFLERFQFKLQRVSELLYDWTDGQAALGRVTIYHNREQWNDAHVRVYASNSRRPSAAQGGIVTQAIREANAITDTCAITGTNRITVTYTPGQAHMGAVWNRYGEAGGELAEDWARTLAHELGHYAFFLDDNYLGFNAGCQLIPVDTCSGAMVDPYRQDEGYDEFHPAANWLPECEQTLSNQITRRADWQTVEAYYPWLNATLANPGPSGLPLAVTRLAFVEPVTPTTAVEDPTFYLKQAGARVQPGNGARAFLFQDRWALDLGRPTLDYVVARGARPGDEVCVYEPAAERLGCETVSAIDNQLEMTTISGWQPDIAVSPVNSFTLGIEVSNVPTDVLGMKAELYPLTAPSTTLSLVTTTLCYSGTPSPVTTTQCYSGTFHLAEPAFEGYVRVLADPADGREMITDYAVGGNSASMKARRVGMRGLNVSTRGSRAPLMSPDGQVILFVDVGSFGADEFYTLQAVTALPSAPIWATLIGQAYRLSASEQAPDLTGASINFSYMADDVPEGAERWLRLYYWDGLAWHQLPSSRDAYFNSVSAPVQGEGIYALMASAEIPLYGPGWNLFGYPVQGSQPIADALGALPEHSFTTVYGQEATDPDLYHRWRIYNVPWHPATWDPGYNTLHELSFGDTYWITVTQAVTLYLKAGAEGAVSPDAPLLLPPATFYGPVLPGVGFSPVAGAEVTAWLGDKLCGRGETMDLNGQVVYRVSVLADEPGLAAGCGEPGRAVRFSVGEQPMVPTGGWNNASVSYLPLSKQYSLYLPLIVRDLPDVPDLVVEQLVAGSDNVQVVIRNQGYAPVRDAFWVDVYVGPRTPPMAANQTWDQLGDEGLVWAAGLDGVPLWPGKAITLTVGDDRYWPDYSHVDWPLARSTPIYAQVDSANAGEDYGAVLEVDELRGLPYNNIAGPVYATPGALEPPPGGPPGSLPDGKGPPERP